MAEYVEREALIQYFEAMHNLAQQSLDEWKAHTEEYRGEHMNQFWCAYQRMQDADDAMMRILLRMPVVNILFDKNS